MNTSLFFVFIDSRLLIKTASEPQTATDQKKAIPFAALPDLLPSIDELPSCLDQHIDEKQSLAFTSEYGKHYLIDIHHLEFAEDNFQLVSLRSLLLHHYQNNAGAMGTNDFQYAAQAWQYALFLRTHRFCGRCANTLRKVSWEMAMHCDKCNHRVYPRVSPCIIVAIHDNKRILLAQGAQQQTRGFYSTLAGFVESAESLEQAVHREVFEEVGVKLKSLEYFGSQPWPFPHSLMVGYIAEYDAGDIVIDNKEILDAQWFEIDDLPSIPPKISIAGRLIHETISRIK
ncbi:NAD(+) diphosphatase [Glaciecola petra]|uniref:NAD(+) diphosphatase n=1 Tax=Glaciecola petra TaxID=3075602 RepID=A0ABU2ZU72_9ALTE|nr:NAD(+) diphosphatase [Aestuariibacter sp. P117]MDT0596188.1 NAD(+) diphosphatase [Aestuariibacter sp. P117]